MRGRGHGPIGSSLARMASDDDERGGGISVRTLAIASVASACTTYIVSRVWGAGTIVGAAASPVIVALVSELLRRPVEKVPTPKVPPLRVLRAGGPRGPGATASPGPDAAPDAEPAPGPRPTERPAPARRQDAARTSAPAPGSPPAELAAPRRDYRVRRIRWRRVFATALAAFAIVAVAYTVVDLVRGEPVAGGSSSLFDFSSRDRGGDAPTDTQQRPPSTSTQPADTTSTTETAPTTPTQTAPTTTTPEPAPAPLVEPEGAPDGETAPTTPTPPAP